MRRGSEQTQPQIGSQLAGGTEPRSHGQAWFDLRAAGQPFDKVRWQLTEQRLGLVQKASVVVDDLTPGTNQHCKSIPSRVRSAGGRGFESAGKIGMGERLAGDRLGINRIALTASRKLSAPVGRARRTDIAYVGTCGDKGHGETPS